FIVVDMKSTNGTYVNGKKIAGPQVLRPADKIYIGDYVLNVEALAQRSAEHTPPPRSLSLRPVPQETLEGVDAAAEDEHEDEHDAPPPPPEDERSEEPVMPVRAMPASMAHALSRKARKADARLERYTRLQKDIHDRLIEYLDLRRMDMERLGDE